VNNNPVHTRRHGTETAGHFPFIKLFFWLIALLIGIMIVYRLSEAAGQMAERACVGAIIVSCVAAIAGMIPIFKVWGKELTWVVLIVFLSGAIRLLIGLLGAVIIIAFTDVQRIQFVFFLGLFYAAFLAIDIWLALWVIRNTKIEEDEDGKRVIHGNIWDIIIQR